jgi:hypothetical protein
VDHDDRPHAQQGEMEERTLIETMTMSVLEHQTLELLLVIDPPIVVIVLDSLQTDPRNLLQM